MINKKNLIFLLIFILLNNCSLDNKTGIWSGGKKEKRRISELEKKQKQIINIEKIYSSDDVYSEEVFLTANISLSKPKRNSSWKMSGLNHQNFMGNIYLSGTDSVFLKKKIGKDKFSISKTQTTLLALNNNIFFSDDKGTIYSVKEIGKVNWKKNIYKKVYKKIYKNLTFSIYQNVIYVADNIGFIYSINLENGKTVWIKNHGVPIKSNIKIFDKKVFLIDQDNRTLCLRSDDGSKIWDVRSVSSFIKTQNLLSLAISQKENLITINSSAELYNIKLDRGQIYWSSNTSSSMLADATDFFKSSDVVAVEDEIIFSSGPASFSYDLNNGNINWENNIASVTAPIIDGENIFIVTENGYFVILKRDTGKVISSNYILKILKEKKQKTKISGFIIGSGKIYSVTLNGYLIISSAASGKVISFKKIGDSIRSAPIISNGKLYILTENSKIVGLN